MHPAFERVLEHRAKLLGLDYRELVRKQSSKATLSRAAKHGLTPHAAREIEDALSAEERKRGVADSKSDQLREWLSLGAEFLMLEDGGALFRHMLQISNTALRAQRERDEQLKSWEQEVREPKKT